MNEITYNNIKFYQIKDFEGYYISKCGKVLSTKNNRGTKCIILKYSLHSFGYPIIHFYNNGKMYNKRLHRLLAIQFIPNPNNYILVEHLDNNPLNYSLDNLEWSTQSKNIKRAYDSGRKINPNKGRLGKKHYSSKKVNQLDLDGNLIKTWYSLNDIKRELEYNISNISECCLGRRKTARGFRWGYS